MEAALHLLSTLGPEARKQAVMPFDSSERFNFNFIPMEGEDRVFEREPELYYFTFFGEPSIEEPWVQNNANHIHTVWRDLEHDFGGDLLRRHYESAPEAHGHSH